MEQYPANGTKKPVTMQNDGDALESALFIGGSPTKSKYATDPDAPVQLTDYTIEVPVLKEDGDENYVLLSTNSSKTR